VRSISSGSSLAEKVGEALREAINAGELRAGQLYSAHQLADQLNVSRTPVREALLGLADIGMVRFERNRGFRVLQRSPRHIAEIFHLRLLLEVPAARLAAQAASDACLRQLRAELAGMRAAARKHDEPLFMRRDRAFHELMLAAGGNLTLASVVGSLRDKIIAVGASTADKSRSLLDIADEHEPILAALQAGDPAAAAAAVAAHLAHTGELLLAQVSAENGLAVQPADTELVKSALAAVRQSPGQRRARAG
jgi:DNA-binding GntR family transcriptional regulator